MDVGQVGLGQERVWRDVADCVVLEKDLLEARQDGQDLDRGDLVAPGSKDLEDKRGTLVV